MTQNETTVQQNQQVKSLQSDLVLDDLNDDNGQNTQQSSSGQRNIDRLNQLLTTTSRLKEESNDEEEEEEEQKTDTPTNNLEMKKLPEKQVKGPIQSQKYEEQEHDQYSDNQEEHIPHDEFEYSPDDKYEQQMHQEQLGESHFDQQVPQDEGLMRKGTQSMTPPPNRQKAYYSDYMHDQMRSTGVKSMPPRDRHQQKEDVYTKLLEIQKGNPY
jgi:hypothetical protein